tara:strand:+ start:499 stop:1497 length:999 start_codon:yes stop_codon:yes gene_type:complete
MSDTTPGSNPLPPEPSPSRRRGGLIVGLVAALVYGLVIYGLVRFNAPNSGMLLLNFLLGGPAGAAIIAVWVSDPRGKNGSGRHLATGAMTVTLMLVAAAVVLREGTVCLVMAAPIFYGTGLLAAFLTGIGLRGRGGRTLCLAILILPLAGVPAEADRPATAQTRWVTTTTLIDAPPATVWNRLVDVRTIEDSEHRWNFSHDLIGIPRPRDARMDGSGVGAVRHLTWARDVRFEEHIIDWQPGRSLAWTFDIGPEASTRMLDEHLTVNSAYLRLEEGRYTLEATPEGGTRLVLTTRYWMRTPINGYAAWWGGVFLGDFHRNVLGVIKARAEQA